MICFVFISYSFENVFNPAGNVIVGEKNVIATLHKAGLKGSDIAWQTGHPLLTTYDVFKGQGSLKIKQRTGRPNLLAPRDTR